LQDVENDVKCEDSTTSGNDCDNDTLGHHSTASYSPIYLTKENNAAFLYFGKPTNILQAGWNPSWCDGGINNITDLIDEGCIFAPFDEQFNDDDSTIASVVEEELRDHYKEYRLCRSRRHSKVSLHDRSRSRYHRRRERGRCTPEIKSSLPDTIFPIEDKTKIDGNTILTTLKEQSDTKTTGVAGSSGGGTKKIGRIRSLKHKAFRLKKEQSEASTTKSTNENLE
jgi:hypothetical protein